MNVPRRREKLDFTSAFRGASSENAPFVAAVIPISGMLKSLAGLVSEAYLRGLI